MKKAKYIVAVILFVLWGQVGLAQGCSKVRGIIGQRNWFFFLSP